MFYLKYSHLLAKCPGIQIKIIITWFQNWKEWQRLSLGSGNGALINVILNKTDFGKHPR